MLNKHNGAMLYQFSPSMNVWQIQVKGFVCIKKKSPLLDALNVPQTVAN